MEQLPEIPINRIWAIQLSNSDYREWRTEEGFETLNVNWKRYNISGDLTIRKLKNKLGQKLPSEKVSKINSIARGIYHYSRLKVGDGIFGISSPRKIEKIGHVVSKLWNDSQKFSVRIKIYWLDGFVPQEVNRNIFDETLEIEKVNKEIIHEFNFPVSIVEEAKSYKVKSAGEDSSRDEYLRVLSNLDYAFEEEKSISPKEDTGGKIRLFYGTNRNRTNYSSINKMYGDQLDELKYGFCDVSIPRGHNLGELERPFKILFIEFFENPGVHVVLECIDELSEEDFINRLSELINPLSDKSGMIFVHGFNTTFAEAARRTGQIVYDIPFNGIAGFFSWPSSGNILSYLKDGENVEASIPDFEKFIEEIIIKTNIEKLHLIAHSLGNKLLAVTLSNLSEKSSFKTKLNVINQIVLGAPDIDQNVFMKNILPKFKNVGVQRTLYSSDQDKALNLSEDLRRGLARLGDAGNSLFVSDGLDTIDASNVMSAGTGHSYIFDTNELLSDLHYLLGWGFKPEQRRLRARKKKDLIYWLFPK